MDALRKMLPHLFSQDWYIGVCAILTAVWFVRTRSLTKDVEELLQNPQSDIKVLRKQRKKLDTCYSVFTTFISIFPLLGMFGTVLSLLGLDMSGDFSLIQDNFFTALTSTAWGIVFAIAFKILNAMFVGSNAEEVLEKSGRILERHLKPNRERL